jgi:hypothetical protein
MVAQMSGHHTLGCGTEERLLHRRRNWIDDGNLRRADEADNLLGESVQEDIDNLLFEGDEVMDLDDVGDDDGQDGSGKSSENREKINPKGGSFFHSNILTNRI